MKVERDRTAATSSVLSLFVNCEGSQEKSPFSSIVRRTSLTKIPARSSSVFCLHPPFWTTASSSVTVLFGERLSFKGERRENKRKKIYNNKKMKQRKKNQVASQRLPKLFTVGVERMQNDSSISHHLFTKISSLPLQLGLLNGCWAHFSRIYPNFTF